MEEAALPPAELPTRARGVSAPLPVDGLAPRAEPSPPPPAPRSAAAEVVGTGGTPMALPRLEARVAMSAAHAGRVWAYLLLCSSSHNRGQRVGRKQTSPDELHV